MRTGGIFALIAALAVPAETGWAKPDWELCNTSYHSRHEEARRSLETGNGVRAVRIWSDLARKGDPEAQLRLGQSFLSGESVERNEALGIKWVIQSANQNCVFSIFLLGAHFYLEDPAKAFYWNLKAASLGDKSGQSSVGSAYYYGHGVVKNPDLAALWFEKAGRQGEPNSQFLLGQMWENGEGGLVKSLAEAVRWYKMAANGGHARAQLVLGHLYSTGRGVPLNFVEAYKWFNLSSASDQAEVSRDAQIQRDLLEDRMSGAELAEGRKASLNFESAEK